MTYAIFLCAFVLPPTLAVAYLCRAQFTRWPILAAIVAIAYASATPWDNAAVHFGLWSFATDKTLPLRLGALPLEEYAFFGLQTLLVALWTLSRGDRRS